MSSVGRKPKPTHLKLVQGNPGKRRIRRNEPQPELEIPPVPHELCDDAKLEWRRVSVRLHALGLLSSIDRAVLAAYCAAYGRWIKAERILRGLEEKNPDTAGMIARTKNGNVIQNPMVGIANKAMSDMVRYAVEFGMSPSARARVNGTEGANDKNDPAADYF